MSEDAASVDALVDASLVEAEDLALLRLRRGVASGVAQVRDVAKAVHARANAASLAGEVAKCLIARRLCVAFLEAERDSVDLGELGWAKLQLAKDLTGACDAGEVVALIREAEALAKAGPVSLAAFLPFVATRYAEAGALSDAIRVGSELAELGGTVASYHWMAVAHWCEMAGDLPRAVKSLRNAACTDDRELRSQMLLELARVKQMIREVDPNWIEPADGNDVTRDPALIQAESAYRVALEAYRDCFSQDPGLLEVRLKEADLARIQHDDLARRVGGHVVGEDMHAVLLISQAFEAGAQSEIERLIPLVGIDEALLSELRRGLPERG
jgi:hypothetical protein